MKLGSAKVVERKALLGNRSNRNVVVLSDSGVAESSLAAVEADISSPEP